MPDACLHDWTAVLGGDGHEPRNALAGLVLRPQGSRRQGMARTIPTVLSHAAFTMRVK